MEKSRFRALENAIKLKEYMESNNYHNSWIKKIDELIELICPTEE